MSTESNIIGNLMSQSVSWLLYNGLSWTGEQAINGAAWIGSIAGEALAQIPDSLINSFTDGSSTFCYDTITNASSYVAGSAGKLHEAAFKSIFPSAKEANFHLSEIVGPGVAVTFLTTLAIAHGTKALDRAKALVTREKQRIGAFKCESITMFDGEHFTDAKLIRQLAFSTIISVLSGLGASLILKGATPRLTEAGLSEDTQKIALAGGLLSFFAMTYGRSWLTKKQQLSKKLFDELNNRAPAPKAKDNNHIPLAPTLKTSHTNGTASKRRDFSLWVPAGNGVTAVKIPKSKYATLVTLKLSPQVSSPQSPSLYSPQSSPSKSPAYSLAMSSPSLSRTQVSKTDFQNTLGTLKSPAAAA